MNMMKISRVVAREILDSRGNPTIEVEIFVKKGKEIFVGRAAAPSGASKGKHEVIDYPAGGVKASIKKLENISKKLQGVDPTDQAAVDSLLHSLDGSSNFSVIGGNASVAVSMAVAKAAAAALKKQLFQYLGGRSLPYPLGNVLGGGKHAGKRAPDIQEFLVLPVGAKNVREAVSTNAKAHKKIRELIEKKDATFAGGKGDEGAWAPNLDNRAAMEIVSQVCEEISEETGVLTRPCLDVAASSLFDESMGRYVYRREGVERDEGEQIDYIITLVNDFRLYYVEDPLHEEDFSGFAELTRKVGEKCLICGDDIFATNVERIKRGIEISATNAILVKPNQIGTLTDTLKAVKMAKDSSCIPVISHRSGETSDETIAHLAVGWEIPIIKTGTVGGERIAKLNELMRIEENLGRRARMATLPIK